jgi:hypothetical protein
MGSLGGVSDEDVAAITHANAMRHFRFDPFSVRPADECTVGALRAGARDVDVTPRPAAHTNGRRGSATTDGALPAKQVKVSDLTGRRGLDR